MKAISRVYYSMPATVLFFTVVPIFYFLFVLAYQPYDMYHFLDMGNEKYTLNLIITSLIVLGVMVLSRILLFILRRVIDLNWSLYTLWCTGEIVVSGLLMSIPLGIGWAGVQPYFTTMSLCTLYLAGILVFPLAILSMAIQIYVLKRKAEQAPLAADERTLIRFYDEQKRLKLIVSSESVLVSVGIPHAASTAASANAKRIVHNFFILFSIFFPSARSFIRTIIISRRSSF